MACPKIHIITFLVFRYTEISFGGLSGAGYAFRAYKRLTLGSVLVKLVERSEAFNTRNSVVGGHHAVVMSAARMTAAYF